MLKQRALKAYIHYETVVVLILLVLLMIMVLWATGLLAFEIVTSLSARLMGAPPPAAEVRNEFFENFAVMHEVYGAFMLILIGLELMKTIIMYLEDHVLHVEFVFTVAMIAIARHAIDIDLRNLSPTAMLGMGVLIFSLTASYFLFRKSTIDHAAADSESLQARIPEK